VCHWTVVISEDHEPLPVPSEAQVISATRAATLELDAIDVDEPGVSDYRGPLLSDVRFEDWSRSALVRIAQELCLQGHLLALSFLAALRRRIEPEAAVSFGRRQFTGVAGLTAERLRAALGLGRDLDALARVIALHPALLPYDYVGCDVELSDRLVIRLGAESAGVADGGWPSMLAYDHLEPFDAIVRSIDPRFRCQPIDSDHAGLTLEVVQDDVAAPVAAEVALARFSTGADFRFADRGTPVQLRL
jgi:hypothetical protein